MTNTKKAILGSLTAIAAIAVPIATVVSCGKKTGIALATTNLAGITENKNLKIKDSEKNSKAILITDAGKVTDKSFNQSAWEAVSKISKQLGLKDTKAIEPASMDKMQDAYQTALNNDYKYWILPGFNHGSKIGEFINKHKAEMIKKGIILIGLDFDPSNFMDFSGSTPKKVDAKSYDPKLTRALNYKTQEAGYLAGYLASQYLVEVKKDKDPTIGAFGGGDFPGVTNFISGYLQGAVKYNTDHSGSTPVKFAGTQVSLDTGFTDASKFKSATAALKSANADIILPVAGPATGTVLAEFSGLVIGVDTDQRNGYSDKRAKLLTSITKGIGQSTYDALGSLLATGSTVTINEGNNNKGIAEKWSGLASTDISEAQKIIAELSKSTNAIYQAATHAIDVTATGGDLKSLVAKLK